MPVRVPGPRLATLTTDDERRTSSASRRIACQPQACGSCPRNAQQFTLEGPSPGYNQQSRALQPQPPSQQATDLSFSLLGYPYVKFASALGEESNDSELTYLQCPNSAPSANCENCKGYHPCIHKNEILVSVDGICRTNFRNGILMKHSSIGVYFAQRSPYNISELLVDGPNDTEATQLRSTIEAFWMLANWVIHEHEVDKIVAKTSSPAVYFGITNQIRFWQANNYHDRFGNPVSNPELWLELGSGLKWFESQGIKVKFWYVPVHENQNAHRLSVRAL